MTAQEISAAVTALGWRYVLRAVHTAVPVPDLAAADLASRVVAAAGPDARLTVKLRPDRLALTLRGGALLPATLVEEPPATVVPELVATVERITAVLRAAGAVPGPDAGGRSVQSVELAIDALDIAAVRPFWQAVLGYVTDGDEDLVDPAGEGPAVWFQQMAAPRRQRNRIHLDISVPHDEAAARIRAALAAGGRLVSDARAPMWWVLADPEGNEACVSTWQGR